MVAVAQISSSLCTCSPISSAFASSSTRLHPISRISITNSPALGTSFSTGSPLLIRGASLQKTVARKASGISIRCEQGTKDDIGGLDIWLGRLAMVGFAVAITVEVSTGKGLLENFGLTSPLPTVALAVTLLVVILTGIFILQSSSNK